MRRSAAVLLLAGVAALGGCSSGPSLAPVAGTVTGPDGKPMPDVLVQFAPDALTEGKVVGSSGLTDAEGKFVLKADDGRTGAVPGPHRVVLIDNAFTAADDADLGKAGRPKRVNRVPRAYSDPLKTPLKITVESAQKTYDLPVK
jgi:hypothetical protein